MIIQPKLRLHVPWLRLAARQTIHFYHLMAQLVRQGIRLPVLRANVVHIHLWLGLACLILLVVMMLTFPEMGTNTGPYLSYDQLGNSPLVPVTGAQVVPASQPCSMLLDALDMCRSAGR